MPRIGPTSYKEVSLAITAGTPQNLHTPASGKKFRVHGYSLASSAAAGVLLKEGAGNTLVLRCPTTAINTPATCEDLGEGVLSAAADNILKVDATATGTITGWVAVSEE